MMNEQPTNEQVLMQVVQQFLTRTNLKGREVDNYAKCFNFLQTIVTGENVVVPAQLWVQASNALENEKGIKVDGAAAPDDAIPVLEEDTSDGEEMISEGAPAVQLDAVE